MARRLRCGELGAAELAQLAADPRRAVQALLVRHARQQRRAAAESSRLRAMLAYEDDLWRRGIALVAGVDEVGAGPLAGPVVAAAVILKPGSSITDIDDSKRLSAAKREALAHHLRAEAVAWCIGSCSVAEIEALNILQAAREAMRRAVVGLARTPDHLLVDSRSVPGVSTAQTAIVKGDLKSQSIAAASIIAKVARDALMVRLAEAYPGYGFEQHKGYGTQAHLDALHRLGPCPLHRRSFGPVRAMFE